MEKKGGREGEGGSGRLRASAAPTHVVAEVVVRGDEQGLPEACTWSVHEEAVRRRDRKGGAP